MNCQPLSREEVRRVIEGRGAASRVPILLHFWVGKDSFPQPQRQAVEQILAAYPEDAQWARVRIPDIHKAPADAPSYRWMNIDEPQFDESTGIDARVAITDWSQLDGVLKDFPDPHYPGLIPPVQPTAEGRYRLAPWWFWLFERHWSLRGMTNALMDFYTNPEEVHRLYRALTDFYLVLIERAQKELDVDGIFTSDDIGMQTGPFFSLATFREFFKPYYRQMIARTHELGMHFWLHTCGCIEPFLEDFIEIGLDVLHPIQKHTMDPRQIAAKFGSRICIWAGFDVQQVIPWGTPEEVRQEVRDMMDTYYRTEGRLMMTAGNAIKGDCTPASLLALFDECFRYGSTIGRKSK